MPHRLSSRKEPPAPTHQPSRATFCIRRTQDAIYIFIAPGAKHRARGHMDAQGAWGGPRPPFGAFTNHPRSKISGDTLLEQMRRDQQIIASRSIIQFGDDDDLHARAHLRAHNDYKFAHAPATAVVATYAKAQEHRPTLPTVVAAAVVVRAERAAPEPKSTAPRRRGVVDRPHQSHST